MATVEQVSELKQKMAEQRAELIAAARGLSPADALRVPLDAEGEEQWTALEQLAHLCEMERTYDAWVRAALEQNGANLAGVPWQPVDIPVEKANGHSVDEMLRALELERAYTLGLIDGLPLESFDRTAVSPMFGSLTVLQWLRSFYRHDRQHGAQILGRQSEYQPNFKGKEPNQRKARLELVARREGGQGELTGVEPINVGARSIELVTFDLDGTLVDTFATIPERVRYAARVLAAKTGRQFSKAVVTETIRAVCAGHPDDRLNNLRGGLGLEDDSAWAADVSEAYGALTLELLRPVEGALDVVARLSERVKVAVITNGSDGLQRSKVARVGLESLLPDVVTSEPAGFRKPAPEIFWLTCARLGVDPEHALHVGDSGETDIDGATAAGMASILLRTAEPNGAGNSTATFEIDSLQELAALLLGPTVPAPVTN